MIGAFVVGISLACWIALLLAKHGLERSLYAIGAAFIAASYAVRDARTAYAYWFERKMQEQA